MGKGLERLRFIAKIDMLKEVAENTPARPLRISSYSWRRDLKKLAIMPQNNKTIAYERNRNVVSKGYIRTILIHR